MILPCFATRILPLKALLRCSLWKNSSILLSSFLGLYLSSSVGWKEECEGALSLVFELALLLPQANNTNKGVDMGINFFITDLIVQAGYLTLAKIGNYRPAQN